MPRHNFTLKNDILNKEFRKKSSFLREKKALQTLQPHPFITELISSYHYELKNGSFIGILSIKYYKGIDLFYWIDENNNGSNINFVRYVLKKILLAYHYAEKYCIFHRDIKPENVILNNDGIVKLIDWELCCFAKYSDKRVGTFEYMAPEVNNRIVYKCNKADIWSIGVMTFCLSTGRRPYMCLNSLSSDDDDITYKDLLLEHIYLKNWKQFWQHHEKEKNFPQLNINLKRCIELMLQKDPKDRPSIEELMQNCFFIDDHFQASSVVRHLKNKTLKCMV